MDLVAQQEELARAYAGARAVEEGGEVFYFLPQVLLPEGSKPGVVSALLSPRMDGGYQTRLYFSQQVVPPPGVATKMNWNGTRRILETNWHAISWQVPGGLEQRLLQMVLSHLEAFR